MSPFTSRYPTPSLSPNSSDLGHTNSQKMVDGLRDVSDTAPLTAFHPPSCDNHAPATHPHYLPPSPPATAHSNELEEGPVSGGSGGQVDFSTRGTRDLYGGGQQQQGYQQHSYDHYAWSESARGGWLPSTAPAPEAAASSACAGNWYAPQSHMQFAASQQSLWVPEYQQPLTQSYYSAAPSQQYNTAANSQLNADALSFAPPVQQNSESVVHQALFERLGIDKAARYSQTSSVPVPAAPPGQKKKKEKRVRKSKREKALEKLAAAGKPDALTSLDLWTQAPVPGENLGEVNAPKEKQKAEPVTSTAPAPAPPAKKKFNPRETKRQHVMQRPVPTPNYLYYATQAPQTLDFSRPLLVILDLNGTLLFRKTYGGSNAFTPRPHVYEFLEYLFSNHTVMVWSSSKPENVAKMCSDLFTPEQRSELAAVWARDKLRLPAAAYHSKVQCYKQLSWVWEDPAIQASIPIPGGVWTQANTVLIDDSFEKSASEPHNQIELEEFMAKPEQMTTNVLGEVARYLDTLRSQRDVSAYMRLYPFFYDPSPPGQVSRQESRQETGQETRSSREEDIDELIKRVTGGR